MPKVKEGYFEDKKNSILDAVERICADKPLNKVTMKDIITETGLSPGAMYSSFSDIDDVIIALVNRLNTGVDFVPRVEQILSEGQNPEDIIKNLLSYLMELINSSILTYGKIISELAFVAVEEGRGKKLKENIREIQMYDYILGTLTKVIDDNITSCYFKPILSKESIYALIFAFMDGLVRELSFAKNYKVDNFPMGVTFEEKDLPKAISESVMFLLHQGNVKGESNLSFPIFSSTVKKRKLRVVFRFSEEGLQTDIRF